MVGFKTYSGKGFEFTFIIVGVEIQICGATRIHICLSATEIAVAMIFLQADIIPAVPSVLCLDDGLVITSMLSIVSAGICRRN